MRCTIVLALLAALMLVPLASAKHAVEMTSGKLGEGTQTVEVEVSNFKLVPFAGKMGTAAHVKGEGHIHYFVNGKDACSAGKATCAAPTDYATTATSFTFKDLKEGDKVSVELVLSDHGPSGTDAGGNLDGSSVKTEKSVAQGSAGIPAPSLALLALAVIGLAAFVRRRT